MRVIYLCDINLDKKMGDVVHTAEIAGNLRRLGAEVLILAPDLGNFQNGLDLTVMYVPMIKINILRPISFRIALSAILFWRLLTDSIDIVYIREIGLSVLPAILSGIFHKPAVIEINNASFGGVSGKPGKILSLAEFYLRKASFKLCRKIIVANKKVRDLLSKVYGVAPGKFEIIPMGANTDLFHPMDKDLCKALAKLEKEFKYVSFVGTLYPFQGLGYLIRAAPLVIKEINNVRFLIVGSGVDEPNVKKLVIQKGLREYFIFAGEKDYESVPLYINSSDLCVSFVTPERGDSFSFPIKIYEYLSCGRPVVAGNLKVHSGLVGTRIAPLVDAADPSTLSKTIVEYLGISDELKEEGLRARDSIVDNYSWKKTAEKTLALFNSLTPSYGR